MQNDTIVMGGLEQSYMRKLALYLQERLDGGIQVEILEDTLPDAARRNPDHTVWAGSADFTARVASQEPEAKIIILDEEESGEYGHVYRYQSREKLYRCIWEQCRLSGMDRTAAETARRANWIAVTADGTAGELLAFSIVCARILGLQERTLYVNLSDCSGMERLFELENELDLSDFILELRDGTDVLPENFAGNLEGVDCLLPPQNPMILHEIGRTDMERFLAALRRSAKYSLVVFAVGNTFCGCEQIFESAKRIFHLTGSGMLHACARDAWLRFIRQCTGEQPQTDVEQIALPEIEVQSCGAYLIEEWAEGPLGRYIRQIL